MSDDTIDWGQLYPLSQRPSDTLPVFGHVSDSTVMGVTSSSSPSPSPIEGRVGKSGRRRSRASRKPPTTLLNTDTANFRAMVQRFTGAPSGTGYQTGSRPVVNFGLDYGESLSQYQIHQHQQQQQQQLFLARNNTSGTLSQAFGNTGDFFDDEVSGDLIPRSATNNGGSGGGGFML